MRVSCSLTLEPSVLVQHDDLHVYAIGDRARKAHSCRRNRAGRSHYNHSGHAGNVSAETLPFRFCRIVGTSPAGRVVRCVWISAPDSQGGHQARAPIAL
jgi:hypothetical protein